MASALEIPIELAEIPVSQQEEQLGFFGDAQLVDGVIEVRPGRAIGDVQHGSDIMVRVFQTAQRHDLLLPVCQPRPKLLDLLVLLVCMRLEIEPADGRLFSCYLLVFSELRQQALTLAIEADAQLPTTFAEQPSEKPLDSLIQRSCQLQELVFGDSCAARHLGISVLGKCRSAGGRCLT